MSEILTPENWVLMMKAIADEYVERRWEQDSNVAVLLAHDAALRSRLAEAERERDEWALKTQQAAMDRDEQVLRAEAAEARIARLEEALRDLLRTDNASGLVTAERYEIARAALEDGK